MSPENSIVSAPSRTKTANRALLRGFLAIKSELLRPLSLQYSNREKTSESYVAILYQTPII